MAASIPKVQQFRRTARRDDRRAAPATPPGVPGRSTAACVEARLSPMLTPLAWPGAVAFDRLASVRRRSGDEKGCNAACGGSFTNRLRTVRSPLAEVD
jgi:hypothetical protein